MTTLVSMSDETKARADQLIRSGEYKSFDELVLAALGNSLEDWIDQDASLDELAPEHRAAIEQGIADIEAGRTYPAEEVFADLHERYHNWRN